VTGVGGRLDVVKTAPMAPQATARRGPHARQAPVDLDDKTPQDAK